MGVGQPRRDDRVLHAVPGLHGSDVFSYTVSDGQGGQTTGSVTVTVIPWDGTPDQFTFVDQVNVAFATPVVSNGISLSGFEIPASISITGGQYSVNGQAYTSAPGRW